ncbi:hypothetical protein J4210_01635 [Candidatus Woesearchaeota archaeon]|nr:hypothetical protein [Candidatus Woesearchaeota archaeon]
MHIHDQILEFLKVTGPTIPTKVAKIIQTDIIIASAHLSDLASQRKVRISSLKFGGSPLYYLPGQEEQLYAFAAGNLNAKDMVVLENLNAKGVLREADLDLLSKVALRALKDFAVPLQVRTSDNSELFWKWHLLTDEATNQLVRNALYPPQAEEPVPILLPEVKDVVLTEPVPLKVHAPEPSAPFSSVEKDRSDPAESRIESPVSSVSMLSETVLPSSQKNSSPRKRSSAKDKAQTILAENEIPIPKLSAAKVAGPRPVKTDLLLPLLERYFRELNITIQEQEIVRKNAEINLSIKVPTVVGKMTYFCKAKKKARCDEKDLSAAYLEAQIKKLPLLFLYSQDLTKKAHEMIATGAFENVIVKKVE